MPELPEVETIRRGVEPHVVGRRVLKVTVREPRLRWPVPADLVRQVEGRRITGTGRRGKYLLLQLDDGARLIVHLGMSGRLFVLRPGHPLQKHDHLDLELEGQVLLRLQDPRRFGAVLLWPAAQAQHPLLAELGPEPFSDAFDGDYLYARSRGRQLATKSFVMDGQVVVGAGNIYAAEALFRAGIRPGRAAGRLSRADCTRLAEQIRSVLAEAVAQGGTTLRDFAGADGAPGYFQQVLQVYGRAGEPCRTCGTPIRGVRIGQRASCYCPHCQR
jgi:formamidopyrimidine-DNA glycosylase